MSAPVIHTIPPVYDAHSRVLILGTFPSPKSREYGFYYGHPQNRFWRVLTAVLKKPLPVTNAEKRALLLENGIAVWDVLQSCEIQGAADCSIKNPIANDLSPILHGGKIRAIFTTGQKAAALYQTKLLPVTGIRANPLPSTSPANAACSLEQLIEAYQILLNFLEEESGNGLDTGTDSL